MRKKFAMNITVSLFVILLIMTMIGCKKDNNSTNEDKILGTWISIDKSDTLDFSDKSNFYKSNQFMRNEHYDYQIINDSIEIRYSGTMYILVHPTRHKYSFIGNDLSIDLSNKSCYGFEMQLITYIKKE